MDIEHDLEHEEMTLSLGEICFKITHDFVNEAMMVHGIDVVKLFQKNMYHFDNSTQELELKIVIHRRGKNQLSMRIVQNFK